MASITDLTRTDNMASAKQPFLTDLNETLDSMEGYINTSLVANLEQLLLDAFPSGYAVDGDGAKNFATYNLYDKQTVNDSYTGGDITIGAVGAWTDVDATNAAITITPDHLTGDFKVTFQFNVESVTSNATNETDVRFRLTDGTTASTFMAKMHLVTGVTTTTNTESKSISHTYNNLTGDTASTVRLQYYITTTTASVIKVLADTSFPIYIEAEKV